jgi:hypothetical protein
LPGAVVDVSCWFGDGVHLHRSGVSRCLLYFEPISSR